MAPSVGPPASRSSRPALLALAVIAALAALVVVVSGREGGSEAVSTAGCGDAPVVRLGGEVSGSIRGSQGSRHCLMLGQAGFVEIRVRADEDTTLALLRDGREIDYDDDSYGSDPAIARYLDAGAYVLVVETYSGSGTATYRLSVD